MKPVFRTASLCFALALSFATNALAQSGLKLAHDSAWEIAGRQLIIRETQLSNQRSEDPAPLFLAIYTKSDTGYDGTGSPGRLLGRAAIDPIAANSAVNNLVATARLRAHGSGEKFTTLTVEEKVGHSYVIADYVVYTSTYTFLRRLNGGVGSEDAAIGIGGVTFRGTNALTGTRRIASFALEEIQNQRAETTGPLRLAIYATAAPYDGSVAPVVVAARVLGMLAPGDYYLHLQGRLTLRRPGRGAFYLALALEEDRGSGFEPITYISYPDPRNF